MEGQQQGTGRSPATLAYKESDSMIGLLAMIASVCAGEGSLVTMPYVLGSIIERYGLSEGASGIVSSLQFGVMAVASVVLSVAVHKFDRRRMAIAAGALIVLAHVCALLADTWEVFLVSRVLTGLGEGAALSLGNAAAAGTRRPHHTFTILSFGMVATATPMYLSVPVVAEHVGAAAVYYVMLGMVLLCFPFLWRMPRGEHRAGYDAATSARDVWRPFPWVLIAILCLYSANNGLWAYSERIGKSIGLDSKTISSAFLVTVILTLLGPVVANLVQRRWGVWKPLTAAIGLQFAALVTLANASNGFNFFIGLICMNVLSQVLVPYLRGLTAFLDASGRLSAASVLSQTVGTMLGPFAAGVVLMGSANYASVGWLMALVIVISWALCMRTALRADALANTKIGERPPVETRSFTDGLVNKAVGQDKRA